MNKKRNKCTVRVRCIASCEKALQWLKLTLVGALVGLLVGLPVGAPDGEADGEADGGYA